MRAGVLVDVRARRRQELVCLGGQGQEAVGAERLSDEDRARSSHAFLAGLRPVVVSVSIANLLDVARLACPRDRARGEAERDATGDLLGGVMERTW